MKSNPKQKAVYLALCILAAIVVWIFVDNFGNNGGAVMHTKWFRDVPITYTGETVLTERGFMLLDEDTVSTVDLEMEGTAFDLALLDKDYIRVTVDLSNVSRTGVQTVTSVIYGYTEEYFRQNITVSDRTPSVITINVAELYHKTVDVRCEISGNVAEGYSAGELQVSPTEIEVRGDQEDVDAVSYAKVTLDLGEDATSTVTGELPIQFYDANDQLLENTSLQTTEETIQVTLPVYVTRELQLTMNFVESAGARMYNVDWGDRAVHHLGVRPGRCAEQHGQHRSGRFQSGGAGQHHQLQLCHSHPGGMRESQRRHTRHAAYLLQGYAAHHGDGHQLHSGERAGGPDRRPADRAAGRVHLRHQRGCGGHYLGQHSGDGGPGGLRLRRGHLHCPRGGDGGGARRGRLRRDVSGACHHF